METLTRYADDPDRFVDRTITQGANGVDLTFSPMVSANGGLYDIAAAWIGDVGATRIVRVPVSTLAAGSYLLHLQVPGGNDLDLGYVRVVERA